MNDQDELTRLISLLLDGALFEEELAELEERLASDAEARRIYLTMVDQQIELGYLVPSAGKIIVPGPWRQWATVTAIAAGIAILLGGLWIAMEQIGNRESQIAEPDPRPEEPPQQLLAPAPAPLPIPTPLPLPEVEPESGVVWEVDFEGGDGSFLGWKGELVDTDLPEGSTGALRSIEESYNGDPDQRHYVLGSAENGAGWFDGRDGAHLNMVLKSNRRSWLNVFASTRSTAPNGRDWELFIWHGGEITANHGEWQTVSIPLSVFKRKVSGQFVDDQPMNTDDLVTSFAFSSIDTDLELIVDRIWVSDSGPGTVTVTRL